MRRWSGDGWVQRTPGKIYVAPNEAMAIATLLEGDFSRTNKAQFPKCMHGLLIAAARQARGDALPTMPMRWNHRR